MSSCNFALKTPWSWKKNSRNYFMHSLQVWAFQYLENEDSVISDIPYDLLLAFFWHWLTEIDPTDYSSEFVWMQLVKAFGGSHILRLCVSKKKIEELLLFLTGSFRKTITHFIVCFQPETIALIFVTVYNTMIYQHLLLIFARVFGDLWHCFMTLQCVYLWS